jgi:hypothetical protein
MSDDRPAAPASLMFDGLPSFVPLALRIASAEGVGALAGLRLHVLGDDGELFSFGEPPDRGPLRLNPEARALLLPCGDTIIGNSAIHTKCIPPFALCMNAQSEQ